MSSPSVRVQRVIALLVGLLVIVPLVLGVQERNGLAVGAAFLVLTVGGLARCGWRAAGR